MPNQRLIDAVAQSDLILLVDDDTSPYSPEKLTTLLRQLVADRNIAGRQCLSGIALAGGDERGASLRVAESVTRLGGLLRNGHAFYATLPEEDFPAADVLDALVTYGWAGGLLGDLESPATLIARARLALQVTPNLPASLRYPANILTRLTTWLGVYDGNKIIANGGTLQTLVDEQENTVIPDLEKGIARVRHLLCAADDRGEYFPRLALRDFQVKRLPGEAQPPPLPEATGPVTFNAGTRELTLTNGLPAHTSSVVSFRQAAGGQEEQGGVSVTNVVGVSNFSPLTPGVTYTLTAAGHNSRGFGPRSAPITVTA